MKSTPVYVIILVIILLGGVWYFGGRSGQKTQPQPTPTVQIKQPKVNSQMSFFITGVNPGKGADLGGLVGADNYCQSLTVAAGAGERTWRAYLSATAGGNSPAINSRDRIGNGPWKNYNGVIIANSLEELHGDNNLNKQTALTEKGTVVNGRGDTPNMHDILTGSDPQGRAIVGDADTTCGNWTSSTTGSAMLGHSDRLGTSDTDAARSWNSSHPSRGCDMEALKSTGGAGLFYCFALAE